MLKIMSRQRRLAGKAAKSDGERYEILFKSLCTRNGVTAIQIPSGMKVRRGGGGKLIPVPQRSPFDFVLAYNGRSAFVDIKVTSSKTFPFSQLTQHQVACLFATYCQEIPSGYVIFFKPWGNWFFFDAKTLYFLNRKESLKIEQGYLLGPELEARMDLILDCKPQKQLK